MLAIMKDNLRHQKRIVASSLVSTSTPTTTRKPTGAKFSPMARAMLIMLLQGYSTSSQAFWEQGQGASKRLKAQGLAS